MLSYEQTIFNRIWKHFVTDGANLSRGVVGVDNDCAYRGSDGDKCAVGIFIPDDIYKPAMENLCFETIFARWPVFCVSLQNEGYLPEDTQSAEFSSAVSFFGEMQDWHDRSASRSGKKPSVQDKQNLKDIAEEWDLCCPTN